MSKQSLREVMPEVVELVDDLRAVFGTAAIDARVRQGITGKPAFWAHENGHELGTRNTAARRLVMWDDRGRSFAVDIPADITIREELQIKRAALEQANARVFDRKGLVEQKQHSDMDAKGE